MNSYAMASLITTKLREDALTLRQLATGSIKAQASLSGVKEKMLREVHLILTLTLGPPPNPSKEFTWDYYDKNDNSHTLKTTPLDFAAELASKAGIRACGGSNVHEFFSLVNDPRNKYGELLTVDRLGNVVGGRGIRYVNVDMDVRLSLFLPYNPLPPFFPHPRSTKQRIDLQPSPQTIKSACITTLRAGHPIFFGCDVGKFSSSTAGIMDTDLIDYELGFNIRLGLDKAARLRTGESAMTHAMVLTGVHVVDGKSMRWRVQNSWGKEAGTEGWFVMTEGWFEEWVYQVVVSPRYVLFRLRGRVVEDRWAENRGERERGRGERD